MHISRLDGTPIRDLAASLPHATALTGDFISAADAEASSRGFRLRFHTDFRRLLELNERETAKRNWYPLAPNFDPRSPDMADAEAFWISGESETGETIATTAGRLYRWKDTSLAEEARLMFFGGADRGQRCIVTAKGAYDLGGTVYYGGSTWVRPDCRGSRMAWILPRLARAIAASAWPLDWAFTFALRPIVESGIVAGYGYTDVTWSIRFPETNNGELDFALPRLAPADMMLDFANVLGAGFSSTRKAAKAA